MKGRGSNENNFPTPLGRGKVCVHTTFSNPTSKILLDRRYCCRHRLWQVEDIFHLKSRRGQIWRGERKDEFSSCQLKENDQLISTKLKLPFFGAHNCFYFFNFLYLSTLRYEEIIIPSHEIDIQNMKFLQIIYFKWVFIQKANNDLQNNSKHKLFWGFPFLF